MHAGDRRRRCRHGRDLPDGSTIDFLTNESTSTASTGYQLQNIVAIGQSGNAVNDIPRGITLPWADSDLGASLAFFSAAGYHGGTEALQLYLAGRLGGKRRPGRSTTKSCVFRRRPNCVSVTRGRSLPMAREHPKVHWQHRSARFICVPMAARVRPSTARNRVRVTRAGLQARLEVLLPQFLSLQQEPSQPRTCKPPSPRLHRRRRRHRALAGPRDKRAGRYYLVPSGDVATETTIAMRPSTVSTFFLSRLVRLSPSIASRHR